MRDWNIRKWLENRRLLVFFYLELRRLQQACRYQSQTVINMGLFSENIFKGLNFL